MRDGRNRERYREDGDRHSDDEAVEETRLDDGQRLDDAGLDVKAREDLRQVEAERDDVHRAEKEQRAEADDETRQETFGARGGKGESKFFAAFEDVRAAIHWAGHQRIESAEEKYPTGMREERQGPDREEPDGEKDQEHLAVRIPFRPDHAFPRAGKIGTGARRREGGGSDGAELCNIFQH